MLHGELTQLVTGLIIVGVVKGAAVDDERNMTKISLKFIIVLVVMALGVTGRKKAPPQAGLWGTIGALSIVNIFIAVLWS